MTVGKKSSKSTRDDSPRIVMRSGPGSCVVVAMSGGVDSSVAAAMLARDGYRVIGVTLRLHGGHDTPEGEACGGAGATARARSICEQLEIPHHIVDLENEFERYVLRPAWEEYARGRTPSPCLLCNENIKFGALLAWSHAMGAQWLATGHYARISTQPDGSAILLRGVDRNKDQSYFLAGLTRTQLQSLMFPLGDFSKTLIRRIAHEMKLPTAAQRESQDACFAGEERSFAETLRRRFDGVSRSGDIIDEEGKPVGRHDGIHRFTIGQRRGIGVSSSGRRWVRAIRPEDATVMLTASETGLNGARLIASGINWLGDERPADPMECSVQIRYRHAAREATLQFLSDDTADVRFHSAVRAITPGQAAVFYAGDRVLGRGWIDPF